jgi:MoxR-like ATPase
MTADIATPRERLALVSTWLGDRVIGQDALMQRLLMALVCGGHLLVEGAPGLAKTRAIKELASAVGGDFHRIQFTPDLLPSDITGSEVYRPADGSFRFEPGPIFHNLILADEVNRAPAKVQSALLEAMAEHQVSIGRNTFRLPDLFLVMATQNPIEQEGTYPLPEAQLDRFLLHVRVDYPSAAAEHRILDLVRREALVPSATERAPMRLTANDIFAVRADILGLHVAAAVQEYLVQLVVASREPERYDAELASLLEYGASPRGTIALDQLARASAWLDGRAFVTPDDVRGVAHDALRHRLVLSYEAEADGVTADDVIERLLARVPVP